MSTPRVLTRELWLPRPAGEVFAFFADARNLDAITPPWLHFRILSPDPAMHEGALLDYRIRLRGVPIRWRTRITAWDPPHRFVDAQLRGPYRLWVHEHTFEPRPGGVLCRDRVEYDAPGGPLVHRLLVAPDLARIFDYRAKRMQELFGPVDDPAP